jgi:hypothetical protein
VEFQINEMVGFFLKDVPYLRPFVQQVVAEQKEIEDWEAGKFY